MGHGRSGSVGRRSRALLGAPTIICFLAAGAAHAEPTPPPPEAAPLVAPAAPLVASSFPAADVTRDRLLTQQTWAMGALASWGVGSMATGAALWSTGRTPFVRAFGVQQLAWGAVDLTIAALSYRGIRSDRTLHEPPAYWERERRKLRTVLAVNVALDVLYVGAGAALARYGRTEAVRGAGVGIVPQGAFLFVFDSAFLLSL